MLSEPLNRNTAPISLSRYLGRISTLCSVCVCVCLSVCVHACLPACVQNQSTERSLSLLCLWKPTLKLHGGNWYFLSTRCCHNGVAVYVMAFSITTEREQHTRSQVSALIPISFYRQSALGNHTDVMKEEERTGLHRAAQPTTIQIPGYHTSIAILW